MTRTPPTHFRLVPDNVSHDTVECLRQLLAQARKGEVVGLAYVGMLRQRAFIVDTAGIAHQNPTFARGMVAALDDELSARVRAGQ
jgi:hypothetical protein